MSTKVLKFCDPGDENDSREWTFKRWGTCHVCGGSIWILASLREAQCEGCYRVYKGDFGA